jgi:hypothetical protein
MNSFTHAFPFLDQPYMAVGCGVPDLLGAADRKCRARKKKALPFVDHEDPIVAAVARGVVQHHTDDHWFHTGPEFNRLNLTMAVEIRKLYDDDQSMRSGFATHVLIEMFIDAWLQQNYPGKAEYFYDQLATVDGQKVQAAINLFATRPTEKFAPMLAKFLELRYIFDYLDDKGTIFRLNHVLRRVGLRELDEKIFDWLPSCRERVYDHIPSLLHEYAFELSARS